MTLLLATACTPKQVDWSSFYASPPQLPSPRAGAYARVLDQPTDPVLTTMARKFPLESSLSGAAAGIALEMIAKRAIMQPWAVRQAAWTAGYPYPVLKVQAWTVEIGGPPPGQLEPWVHANLQPGDDLGLVRARDPDGDIWMALVGRPLVDLGPMPKELPVGSTLTLPPVAEGHYRWVTATGRLEQGALDTGAKLQTDATGEHLLEVTRGGRLVALMPFYVGIMAPTDPLFSTVTSPREPEEAAAAASALVQELREVYGGPEWRPDPLLDAGARKVGDDADAERLAKALGYSNGRVWRCRAQSVEDCLDRVVWDPELRPALLEDQWTHFGLVASLDGQVALTVLLGAAE